MFKKLNHNNYFTYIISTLSNLSYLTILLKINVLDFNNNTCLGLQMKYVIKYSIWYIIYRGA